MCIITTRIGGENLGRRLAKNMGSDCYQKYTSQGQWVGFSFIHIVFSLFDVEDILINH